MKRTEQLPEKPKPGQIWRTHKGHRVRIFAGLPGCIESAYVEGRVNGRLGINFDMDGNAISSDDWLEARER